MTENSRTRILHICKVYLPVRGGIQKVVHNITTLLSRYAHSVTTTGEDGAISFEKMGPTEVSRCRSYGQIASMPIAPSLISKVVKQARQFQLIAIHYPFPLAELALLFVFWAPPIVVHWHSDIVAQKKLKWLVAPLTWLLLLRAGAIVVTSERMLERSWFLRHFHRKLVFIPYGLSAAESPRTSTAEQDYFLIIGRHVSYKGIAVAIRALENTSLRLVIAGDGPLYEQHNKLATELGLRDRIKFERYASDEEVISLLSHCTALVVPSVMESEAFALVQLEAMRLGKAVINTNLKSSVPWVARHQREALTVPVKDSEALAEAMVKLSCEPLLAEKLGSGGLRRYHKLFSAEKFATEIDNLYTSLITTGQLQSDLGKTQAAE